MGFALFTIAFITVITVVIIVILIAFSRMTFPGEKAEIEQLRDDINGIDLKTSHEVFGQVSRFNQKIRIAKTYRKIWWSKAFYPKGWESIEELSIPKKL